MTCLGNLIKGKGRSLTREILKRAPGGKAAAMQKTVSDKDIQEIPAPWEAAVFLIIDGVLLRCVGRDTFGTV